MMGVIFFDSCGDAIETGTTGNNANNNFSLYVQDKYDFFSGSAAWRQLDPSGRRGGNCFQIRSTAGLRKAVPAQSTYTVGFAHYLDTGGDIINPYGIVAFVHGTTTGTSKPIQVGIALMPDHTLGLFCGTTLVGQSVKTIEQLNWYYIELGVNVGQSGSATVRVNGRIEIHFQGDTNPQETGLIDNLWIGQVIGSRDRRRYYDDVYISDDLNFLGNIYVGTDTPTLTVQSQGTPSDPEADNHEMVNEIGSGAPDDDETYVALEPGQKDIYGFDPIQTNGKVHAIQLTSRYRSQDGGIPQVKLSIESDDQGVHSIDTPEANQEYRYKNTVISTIDPATGLPWEKSGVDEMKAGIEILDNQ